MNNFTLLYIEDDLEILENTTFLLSKFFSKIHTALDGEEALEKYHKYHPDIILSDINIPKLDGLALVAKIREDNKDIPIIMLTAFSDSDKLLSAIDIGVSSYVTKPVSMDKLREAVLKAQEEKTRQKQQHSLKEQVSLINENVIMLNTDAKGLITEITDAFVSLCGYSRDELIGAEASIVKSGKTDRKTYKELWATLSSGAIWSGEFQNIRKDGNYYWVSVTITPLFNEKSEIKGYTAIQIDITDKKIAQNQAVRDSLTSLYNRTIFDETVQRAIDAAKRYDTYFTYLMLDIDHFKEYNDTYGHMSGDEALRSVATVLDKYTNRVGDYAFRIGGEEFSIVLTGLDEDKSLSFANKIRENILALNIEHSGNSSHKFLSMSIGLYVAKGDNIVDKGDVFCSSDEALYFSKNQGRNRVTICA